MNLSDSIVLSTAYLGPIQYFVKILQFDNVMIEQHENYIKQSYRNRCVIYGANGALSLTIPVKKDKPKTIIKDISLDYDTNWRKNHWKSIESAYRSSPFFDFYADDLKVMYDRKPIYLLDFNTQLLEFILEHIDIENKVRFTDSFIEIGNESVEDFRYSIDPKQKSAIDLKFKPTKYYQVFEEKHGFISGLSIIDLLFNEGPQSLSILENCTV